MQQVGGTTVSKTYRHLAKDEVVAEGDEQQCWEDAGLAGGYLTWEAVPPWMVGKQANWETSIRRPVDTEKEELRKALQTCLHVIEKGIEVRMMDQWPVLKQVLPQAKEQARKALGLEVHRHEDR